MGSTGRVSQIETVLREWLEEPSITLFCGDWRNGAIMEILPEGRAVLTRPKYPEPFSGLRDIALPGHPHHLHIDLDKLCAAIYAVTPCVCYGYRPSFEVRFCDTQSEKTAFSLAVRSPYSGRRANRPALSSYFRKMLNHHKRFPDVTRFHVDPSAPNGAASDGWNDILGCFLDASGSKTEGPLGEPCLDVLRRSVEAVLQERHDD